MQRLVETLNEPHASDRRSLCVGWLVDVTDDGQALVDYPDSPNGPTRARSLMQVSSISSKIEMQTPVLLLFENGDSAFPIIVGVISDSWMQEPVRQLGIVMSPPDEVTIDKKRITIQADREIVLKCGKSSITLTNDGRVIVKGTEIVSRSSGTQKIRGACVKIN